MRQETDDYKPGYNPDFVRHVQEARRREAELAEKIIADPFARKATSHLPDWVRAIIYESAAKHGVAVSRVMSESRSRDITPARQEAVYRVKQTKPLLSSTQIGKWFNREHTTIISCLAAYSARTGAPLLTNMDLDTRRKRNARKAKEIERAKYGYYERRAA